MKDPKTTITGIVGGIAGMLGAFHLLIPPEVAGGVVAIAVFLVGLFAKDSLSAPSVK